MAEELVIKIVDGGDSSASASAPSQAATGSSGPVSHPTYAPPTSQPPPFVQPPPVQPPPFSPPRGERGETGVSQTGAAKARVIESAAIASTLASGQVSSAISAAASTAVRAITSPIGIAAAAFTGGIGVVVAGLSLMTRTIRTQVEELSGLSANVARAQARTEVGRLRLQRERAGRLGPSLEAAERIRFDFEKELTRLNTELLKVALDIFRSIKPISDIVGDALGGTAEDLSKLETPFQKIMLLLVKQLPALQPIADLMQEVVDKLPDPELEQDDFFAEFMKMVPNPPLFWPRDQPLPGANPGPVGV